MTRSIKPYARAGFVVAAVCAIVSAVTYAALSDRATLADNTISSATSELKISKNNISYGSSKPGFAFNDVVPGSFAVPVTGHAFWLRNDGDVPLQLNVGVVPSPTSTVLPGPGEIDFSKVKLHFQRVGGGPEVEFTLQGLIDANATSGLELGEILAVDDDSELFTIKASYLPDAFTGSNATLEDLDIVFFGISDTE